MDQSDFSFCLGLIFFFFFFFYCKMICFYVEDLAEKLLHIFFFGRISLLHLFVCLFFFLFVWFSSLVR